MRLGGSRAVGCLYVAALVLLAGFGVYKLGQTQTVSAVAVNTSVVVIDAGHGGVDGGALSPGGVRECDINLAIARRIESLFGLLGRETLMLRTVDTDLSGSGASTIAQKKVSDIRSRVAAINGQDDAVLVSIHQNTFPEAKYRGAQVFYGREDGSKLLGELLQLNLETCVDPTNTRKAKSASASVYLMQHITCPGVLVECGFLTNAEEETLLQREDYQKKLATAIACTVEQWVVCKDEV